MFEVDDSRVLLATRVLRGTLKFKLLRRPDPCGRPSSLGQPFALALILVPLPLRSFIRSLGHHTPASSPLGAVCSSNLLASVTAHLADTCRT